MRAVLAVLLVAVSTLLPSFAQQANAPTPGAKPPIFVYAYQEGEDPADHTKHTLFLIGDGASGAARYTAAAFKDGRRYSLAASGNGTYSISGSLVTIKAGALDGAGEMKPGEFIEIGSQRFTFAMKM